MTRLAALAALLVGLALTACGGSGSEAFLQAPGPAGANYVPGIAYLADAEVDERVELFTASLDGSQFLKVSSAIGPGGSVHGFAWSPDRALLAYLARPAAGQPVQLFVVAPTGGPVTQVSTLVAGTDEVVDFAWAPNSQRLAFREFRDGMPSTFELWSVAPDGTGLAPLSVSAPGTTVGAFAWSPDATRVAYVRGGATGRLWVAPGAGGAPTEATQALDPADSVSFAGLPLTFNSAPFAWAPDSSRLAFVAHHVDMSSDVVDLYSVLPDGTGLVPLYQNSGNEKVGVFAWAPDGTRIAFIAGVAVTNDLFLRTVLPAGGGTQILQSASEPVRAVAFAWAPDASKIALVGEMRTAGLIHVFVTAPDVDALTAVGPFETYGLPFALDPASYPTIRWSPDGSHLACVSSNLDLHVGDGAGPNFQLDLADTRVTDYAFSPDSTHVAYVGDAVVTDVLEAIVTGSDTSYGTVRVSPPLGVALGVTNVAWSTNGAAVLYIADVRGYFVRELWASSPDGSSVTLLSGPLTTGGEVRSFAAR